MRGVAAALVLALTLGASGAAAYAPGSGNLFSDDAARTLAAPESHALHPVDPGVVDACFGATLPSDPAAELVLELRPPRDDVAWHALVLRGDGSVELRSRGPGRDDLIATGGARTFSPGAAAWFRWQLRPGAGGATDCSLRTWTGGPAAEPARWTLQGSTPGADPCPRVQRFRASTTVTTTTVSIQDIEVSGDTSAGVPSSITTVHVVELSHLDVGFTKPPDEIEAFAKQHLDDVLANLRADPAYRWTIENSWQLERWAERSTPAEIDEMTQRLREGRISLCAGYANLHSTVCTRDEIIRAVEPSLRWARDGGFRVRTYVEDDVPGATWALPEVLAKSGVEFYLGGMNTPFGGALTEPNHATRPFWWEGPDGSRVLSWITFDSYAEGLGKYGMSFFDDLAALDRGLASALPEQEVLGYPHSRLLVMRAFDNHYQGRFVENLVNQWNAAHATPRLVLSSPEEFFDALMPEIAASGWAIPTYRGDFGGAWTSVIPGTPETQRLAEQAKRDVEAGETFSALASLLGEPHPTADLATAWRRVTEVDEHSGGGAPWPGYMTPEQADRQNREHLGYAQAAASASSSALQGAMSAIASRVELPRGGIVVFNAIDQARTGPVRCAVDAARITQGFRLVDARHGEDVAWQRDGADAIVFVARDVPPLGWSAFRFVPGAPPSDPGDLDAQPSALTNAAWRIAVDPSDGSLASIVHVADSREILDAASPWRFGQSASNTNALMFFGVTPTPDVPTGASVRVLENGPVRARLAIDRRGTPASSFVVTLWRGLDCVDVEATVDEALMPYVPESDGSRALALTLPFDLHDFEACTESPAKLLRPASDGFARAQSFASLNSTAAISAADANGTLVLATPGYPIAEWGGISQLVSAQRTSDAVLFVHATTKVDEALYAGNVVGPVEAEPGMPKAHVVPIRWTLLRAGAGDTEIRRAGWDLADDLRAVAVDSGTGDLPAGGRSILSSRDPSARIFGVHLDGGDLVAQVEEMGGAVGGSWIRSLAAITSASFADIHGAAVAPLIPSGPFLPVTLRPFGTTTIRLSATLGPSPTLLRVTKDEARGDVLLRWSGGLPDYRVLRSASRDLASSTVLDPAQPAQALDDVGSLRDGALWFYDVQ